MGLIHPGEIAVFCARRPVDPRVVAPLDVFADDMLKYVKLIVLIKEITMKLGEIGVLDGGQL